MVSTFPTSNPLTTSLTPHTEANPQSTRSYGHSGNTPTEQVTPYPTVEVTGDENTTTDSRATESLTEHQQTKDEHQWSAPEQSTTEDEPRKWSTDSLLMRPMLSSHTSNPPQSSTTSANLPKQSKRSVAPRKSLRSLGIDPEDGECDILHKRIVPSLIAAADEAQHDFEFYVSILSLQHKFPPSVPHLYTISMFEAVSNTLTTDHLKFNSLYVCHFQHFSQPLTVSHIYISLSAEYSRC